MYYSIGEVSEMFNIPISTLRYYDKEGFFPDMERISGIRKFSENEIETLRIVDCLKKSKLEIKEIKQFIDWTRLGAKTYEERRDLFEQQKKNVQKEIEELEKTMSMLKYKSWYYEQAIKDGSEDRLHDMIPDKLPKEVREWYNHAHEEETK